MRKFNFEEAKAGKPVCTRDGRDVRIICFDRLDDEYPIVALIRDGDDEICGSFSKAGLISTGVETNGDLMMAAKKHHGWINVYKYSILSSVYDTKELADAAADESRIDCIKIEWEE